MLIASFAANLAAGAAELPLPPQLVWPPLDKGFAWRPFDKTPSTYTGDFGLRFWYGRSSTAKNLYDPSGRIMVSRLTYDNLSIFAAEAYTRFDIDRRWFIKGNVGGGALRKGFLTDEDFPPAITPYSATFSVQENGSPIYASGDAGFNALFGPDFRVGLFVGFHYLNETVSAYGCTQEAFNPFVCGPTPINNRVKVIKQDNNWYSMVLASMARGRSAASSSAPKLPGFPMWGFTALTRICCESAMPLAISTARYRRTAAAGAISSRASCNTV